MPGDLKSRLASLRGSATTRREATLASLTERMRRLSEPRSSVQAKARVSDDEVARALRGERLAEGVIVVERFVPLSVTHGRVPLKAVLEAPIEAIFDGAIRDRCGLLFLDTETTGLAGGTGTLAFLLGLARIEADRVHVRQYFLTAFRGECAMLDDAGQWLGEAQSLVSFNGKSFDVPLLAARYRLARATDALHGLPHIDLLHPTRAAFGKSWPDCRLQTAEKFLFKLIRDDDVPGHLIPEAWTQFLCDGVTAGLDGILEHNFRDVLSLVALLAVVANAFNEPGHDYADAFGIARSQLRRGQEDSALLHLKESAYQLDEAGWLKLAWLHRRNRVWQEALAIWEKLAEQGSIAALEQLAKYYEHVKRDWATALRFADQLLTSEPANADYLQRQRRLTQKAKARAPSLGLK